MIRGIEKLRIVDDDEDRQNFVKRLGNLSEEMETRIYAWSLLPNHAHLFLRSGPAGLPKFMRRFLTGYTVTYNHRHLRHGHLFQNRYHFSLCATGMSISRSWSGKEEEGKEGVPRVRSEVAQRLIEETGMSLAEVARLT